MTDAPGTGIAAIVVSHESASTLDDCLLRSSAGFPATTLGL